MAVLDVLGERGLGSDPVVAVRALEEGVGVGRLVDAPDVDGEVAPAEKIQVRLAWLKCDKCINFPTFGVDGFSMALIN